MADAGAPPPAELLLSVLAQDLANDYESVSDPHSILSTYIHRNVPKETRFRFSQLTGTKSLAWKADSSTVRCINELGKYFDGGALGGAQGVLLNYLRLPESTAFEILRTSETNTQALKLALSYVPERERKERLSSVIVALEEISESARSEPAFRAFSTRDWPSPESRSLSSAEVRQSGRQRFSEVLSETFPSPQSRTFESMMTAKHSLGGIIFGNTITNHTGHTGVNLIQWIGSQDGSRSGRFLVTFRDGAEVVSSPIREEDAYAAYSIVFTSVNGVPPAGPDQGIGLLGADSVRLLAISATGVNAKGWLCRIAIHPALEKTDLGWAAIIADTQPRDIAKFSSLIGRDNFTALTSTGWIPDKDGRRISDVPISIEIDGPRIFAVPTAELNEKSVLYRSIFLSMTVQPADGHAVGPQFERIFHQAMPTLIQRSYNYERLNEFASVLAIVRWAKSEGAAFKGKINAPRLPSTPPAVFHNSSLGYVAKANFDPGELEKTQCLDLAKMYLKSGPENRKFWLDETRKYCGDDLAQTVQRFRQRTDLQPPGNK